MALENEWQTHEDKFNNDVILHRPTNEEYAFYTAVSRGDLETVRQNCESKRFTDLRNRKVIPRCSYKHQISFCNHCRDDHSFLCR